MLIAHRAYMKEKVAKWDPDFRARGVFNATVQFIPNGYLNALHENNHVYEAEKILILEWWSGMRRHQRRTTQDFLLHPNENIHIYNKSENEIRFMRANDGWLPYSCRHDKGNPANKGTRKPADTFLNNVKHQKFFDDRY